MKCPPFARPAAVFFFMGALMLSLSGCPVEKPMSPVAVVLDTDMESDVDDVGAVAVLHALADRGEAVILGMAVSSDNDWSVRCLQALNGFFRRPAIPVGRVAAPGVRQGSKYAEKVAREFGPAAAMPPENAVALYRRLLAAAPDKSVVIISVGYLTNIGRLLDSDADAVSPMDGTRLAAAKVKRLVIMGGQYPSGREWNVYQDAGAAGHVVAAWPTPVVFCGFELGAGVMTGASMRRSAASPVRRAYELYNGFADRSSWDQVAVLAAVRFDHRERARMWRLVDRGENLVAADGANRWRGSPDRDHSYLVALEEPAVMARRIELLMHAAVIGKQGAGRGSQ